MKSSKLIKKITRSSGDHLRDAAERMAHGRMISSRFFKRYMFQIVFVVALLMVYIANRYDCVTGMETIVKLRRENAIVKTRLQSERAAYMTAIRESAIQQKADSLGLGLSIQHQPPYTLRYAPNDK